MACSTGWFLHGVSCYKENNKDTWKDAQQVCTASGGDLVKVHDDNQKRFLIHFMKVIGLKKMNIYISTDSIPFGPQDCMISMKFLLVTDA